ncbi:hypothetical protein [Rheinheimera texasensis]|jgi:hypothetical protein|uniref:hypothetical protein n=1 Tax=Rheinheimera texasensis TaxID=306205 RepID=UPI000A78E072|nr:hypothetical protein [Rheinheimera texasensis]
MTESNKYQRFDQFVLKRRSGALQDGQSTSRRRSRLDSPKGAQEKSIDATIWQLHSAMVDKILANPALLAPVVAQLEQEQQQGLLRHSAYLFWSCAFAMIHQPALFRAALLSQEPQACKHRRRTRLRGILTEAERALVLAGQWQPATAPDEDPNDTTQGETALACN